MSVWYYYCLEALHKKNDNDRILQGVRTWGPISPPVLSCGKCSGWDWWWYRECEREEPLPRGTRLSTEGKPWTGRWYSEEICTWSSSCGQIVRDNMVGVISRGWCIKLCDAGGCRFVRTISKIAWPRTWLCKLTWKTVRAYVGNDKGM